MAALKELTTRSSGTEDPQNVCISAILSGKGFIFSQKLAPKPAIAVLRLELYAAVLTFEMAEFPLDTLMYDIKLFSGNKCILAIYPTSQCCSIYSICTKKSDTASRPHR